MGQIKVAYVFADSASEWNCSEWRCLAPSNAINFMGEHDENWRGSRAKLIHISGFTNFLDPIIQDIVMDKDLIIVQRNLIHQAVFDAMNYYIGLGKAVAVDLDDAYQMLPWSNPAHRFWTENAHQLDPKPLAMLEMGLQLAGHLITPNRRLLKDWEHVAKGYYLPNFARQEWWTNLPSRRETKRLRGHNDRVVIGWGGSVSHYDSWWGSGLREAAERISRRHPEVLWLICGNDPRIYTQLDVSVLQKTQQPGVAPEDWPKIVQGFDIGVAPLCGEYDQRRSWIKGLEYLLAGVPWVGAVGEPYRDLAELGTLVPPGAGNWEEALEHKIAHLREEQELAETRIATAQTWFAVNQMATYEAVYRSICQDYEYSKAVLPGVIHV